MLLARGIYRDLAAVGDVVRLVAVNRSGRVCGAIEVPRDGYRPNMAARLRMWLDEEWDPTPLAPTAEDRAGAVTRRAWLRLAPVFAALNSDPPG